MLRVSGTLVCYLHSYANTDVVSAAEVRPKNAALKSTLPAYSTPNFSGREKELSEIDSIFKISDDFHKRVALYGLGGIG
jgi:hypothetical protein